MNDIVISTNALDCKIGHRQLLHHITWNVRQGEHWTVLGMNGSGKTTLLSIIAGYLPYSGGTLTVFGAPYSAENILEHRKKIGFVSSSFYDRYYHNETALEIVLAAKYGSYGLDFSITNQDVIRARKIMAYLKIGDKTDRIYKTMSKGERQSVLIARALYGQPEILLLDEPCSGLDIGAREKILTLVQDLARQTNITIIYVTHYLDEILPEFENMLLLRRGFLYRQGRREELLRQETLRDFLEADIELHRTPLDVLV